MSAGRYGVTLAVAGLSGVLLAACGGGDSTVPTADDLDGSTYTSTDVTGHELVEGTSITLSFESGNLGAQAGCNTMTSAFEIEDDILAWTGEVAATLMGCPDELTAQDEWLTGLLTDGVDVVLEDDTLVLTSDDQTIKLAPAE